MFRMIVYLICLGLLCHIFGWFDLEWIFCNMYGVIGYVICRGCIIWAKFWVITYWMNSMVILQSVSCIYRIFLMAPPFEFKPHFFLYNLQNNYIWTLTSGCFWQVLPPPELEFKFHYFWLILQHFPFIDVAN